MRPRKKDPSVGTDVWDRRRTTEVGLGERGRGSSGTNAKASPHECAGTGRSKESTECSVRLLFSGVRWRIARGRSRYAVLIGDHLSRFKEGEARL